MLTTLIRETFYRNSRRTLATTTRAWVREERKVGEPDVFSIVVTGKDGADYSLNMDRSEAERIVKLLGDLL